MTTHECRSGDWKEVYYGYECRVCGAFVPFGGEPWAPDDGEVADMVRDALDETRAQAERVGARVREPRPACRNSGAAILTEMGEA